MSLAGWGYTDGLVPTRRGRPLSALRTRPAHARRHVWTEADDAWLREHAALTMRVDLMMAFDCGPEELTRHLRLLGLQARHGNAGRRRDGQPDGRVTRHVKS